MTNRSGFNNNTLLTLLEALVKLQHLKIALPLETRDTCCPLFHGAKLHRQDGR